MQSFKDLTWILSEKHRANALAESRNVPMISIFNLQANVTNSILCIIIIFM